MDNQPNEKDLSALLPAPEVVQVTEKPKEKSPYSLILGLRRIHEGPFSGLWELTQLEGDVSVKRVIMDASTRGSVIGMAATEMQKAL